MRFKKYLKEEREKYIIPKTKKFKFFWDNPMGEWLENERKRSKSSGWGSVTAGFNDFMQIPVKILNNVKGKMGEVRSLKDRDVQDLMQSIKEFGLHNPIFINIEYDGTPKVNEGNRRLLIAKELKWKYIPIEIKYYAGGELIDTPFHPDRLVKAAKPWSKPKTKLPIIKKVNKKTEDIPKKEFSLPKIDKEAIDILKKLKLI